MTEYLEDVKKYVDSPREDAVESLVGHLRLSLQNRDAAVVAASEPDELSGIKNGYCRKTLDLTPEEADAAIAKVCEKMKGNRAKSRVTFYYLLADASGTLSRLAP